MRHRRATRHFNRTASHRLRMLQHLAEGLFRNYQIVTTVEKAKEARAYAEPLITRARKGDPNAQREVRRVIHDKLAYQTLVGKLGPHFADRPGGYTRILRLGRRPGDGAEQAVLELVGREALGPPPGRPTFKKKAPKTDQPAAAAG
jgi:large subunit ribosomal protein L17